MRSRLIALAATAGVLALSGCTAEPAPTPLPPVRVVTAPAASAGGACIYWDYQLIEDYLGVTFTVAAGGSSDETSTCVVRTEDPEPTLMLTVVGSTSADAALFTSELMPDKAAKVKGLGKAGYKLVKGSAIEVGWLSFAGQIQSLTYTMPDKSDSAEVADMTGRLIELAQTMTTVNGKPVKPSKP